MKTLIVAFSVLLLAGSVAHAEIMDPPRGGPAFEHDRGWDRGPHGPGPGFRPGFPPPILNFSEVVQCENDGYNVSYCPVNGFIVNARVINQRSYARCELGRSFGFQGNNVWVKDGCRATFEVVIRR